MTINIPIQTTLQQPNGFDQLAKEAKRAEREAIASTRRQIQEHRNAANLTRKLDNDIAKERQARNAALAKGGAVAGVAIAAGAAFYLENALEAATMPLQGRL